MLPAQSQIWAVLRAGDSLRRINYSMVNGFLGVLCLSGDVYDLSDAQWKQAEEGISFYKEIRPIVQRGVSYFYGERSESMRHPEGWQAVCRRGENGETLVTVHTFGGARHPAGGSFGDPPRAVHRGQRGHAGKREAHRGTARQL